MTAAVRDAVPGDEALLLSFIKELADYEHLDRAVVSTEQDMTDTFFGPEPSVFAMIAETEEGPCGFAIYFFNYSSFLGRRGLFVEDLYVRPSLRGSGVGVALMSHAAKKARAAGCKRMEWTVLNWNQPAKAFYENLGARPLEDWTVYRLGDEQMTELAERSGA